MHFIKLNQKRIFGPIYIFSLNIHEKLIFWWFSHHWITSWTVLCGTELSNLDLIDQICPVLIWLSLLKVKITYLPFNKKKKYWLFCKIIHMYIPMIPTFCWYFWDTHHIIELYHGQMGSYTQCRNRLFMRNLKKYFHVHWKLSSDPTKSDFLTMYPNKLTL